MTNYLVTEAIAVRYHVEQQAEAERERADEARLQHLRDRLAGKA